MKVKKNNNEFDVDICMKAKHLMQFSHMTACMKQNNLKEPIKRLLKPLGTGELFCHKISYNLDMLLTVGK